MMQKLKNFVSKITRIWWNLTWTLASLQNLYIHLLLLRKVFNVWPKKAKISYLWWHSRLMQNLKKNWLMAWKMTWGIWQIFTRAFENLKIGILMESFNPKYNKYELKIHRGLMCHENEEWCKIPSRIWGFLIRALESLRNFHFNVVLLTKAYIAWAKKVQRSNLHETEQVCKIWRGIDLSF